MKEYQAEALARAERARQIPALPAEITDAASRFIGELWSLAAKIADQRVNEAEAQAQGREAELSAQLVTAQNEIENLSKAIGSLESELEVAKALAETSSKGQALAESERSLLQTQMVEKDVALRAAVERAAIAEKLVESRSRELDEVKEHSNDLKAQIELQSTKRQQCEQDLAAGNARLGIIEKQLAEKDVEIRSLL